MNETELWINSESFYSFAELRDGAGTLLPTPYPLVQGFTGALKFVFTGNNLPREDETLRLAFRLIGGAQSEVFSTQAGAREEVADENGEPVGVSYSFELTADSVQFAEAIEGKEEILLQGGIVAYVADEQGAFVSRREWQAQFAVSPTALTGTKVDPAPTALQEHDADANAHPDIRAEISSETSRASATEAALSERLDAEAAAREASRAELAAQISAESQRAEAAETELDGKVAAEAVAREQGDAELRAALVAETARAEAAETELEAALNAESARASAAENDLAAALNAEAAARELGDAQLAAALEAAQTSFSEKLSAAETAAAEATDALRLEMQSGFSEAAAALAEHAGTEAIHVSAKDREKWNAAAQSAETNAQEISALRDSAAAEAASREQGDAANAEALAAEIARAEAAEAENAANLSAHKADASNPHGVKFAQTIANFGAGMLSASWTGGVVYGAGQSFSYTWYPTQEDMTFAATNGTDYFSRFVGATQAALYGSIGGVTQGFRVSASGVEVFGAPLAVPEATADNHAVSKRQLNAETASREQGDAANAEALADETAAREREDAGLSAKIDAETAAREASRAELAAQISAETARAEAAETEHDGKIAAEAAAREQGDAANADALAAETARAEAAETELDAVLNGKEGTAQLAMQSEGNASAYGWFGTLASLGGVGAEITPKSITMFRRSGSTSGDNTSNALYLRVLRAVNGAWTVAYQSENAVVAANQTVAGAPLDTWIMRNIDGRGAIPADESVAVVAVLSAAAAASGCAKFGFKTTAAVGGVLSAAITADAGTVSMLPTFAPLMSVSYSASGLTARVDAAEAKISALESGMSQEAEARAAADAELGANLAQEESSRRLSDEELDAKIAAEIARAIGAETALGERIDDIVMNAGTSAEAVQANLTVEIQRAQAAEAAEAQARAEADQLLNDALAGKLDKTEAAATYAAKSEIPDMSGYAKTQSPTFTGTPLAPTPPTNSWNQQIATTAFVQQLLSGVNVDTSGLVASASVTEIVALSQESYDALPAPAATTLYVII